MKTKVDSRGFYGIGIYACKTPWNVANLFRSAFAFRADFLFLIGTRYKHQCADTPKTPKHIPLYEYENSEHFLNSIPWKTNLISIDCGPHIPYTHPLERFVHPERACYVLGAEDFGISQDILDKSDSIVSIDTRQCLNVANAGAILMYDRHVKRC